MPDTFNFPNGGYEIKVLRKQDVLDCIDKNIIDKEIALDIVRRCEIDAANFIRTGKWAGIPFVGNIRIPKAVQKFMSDEINDVLNDARENLDRDKYLLFRKQIGRDVAKSVEHERYYKYEVSKFVGKNLKFFKALCNIYGNAGARLICFTIRNVSIIGDVIV